MSSDFVLEIRRALADNANPDKAEGMRAYMKSEMLFHGVQKPLRRKLFREALEAHPIAGKRAWSNAVLDLWRNAAYREERYMALELAGAKQYLPFRELDAMAMFEEMVVTGAWWDFVDEVATHRLREILERFPKDMSPRMRSWSRGADMWKRRSAIICQVGRKERTDGGLLFDCIDPTCPTRTSSSERRSDGPCGTWRGPVSKPSSPTSHATRTGSAPSPAVKRSRTRARFGELCEPRRAFIVHRFCDRRRPSSLGP